MKTSNPNQELIAINKLDKSQILFDYAEVLFVEINTKGIVTLVNKKTCELLGYKEQEILGKNWFENFIPKENIKEIKEVSEKITLDTTKAFEFFENTILTKTGEEKNIQWHNMPLINEKGDIIGSLSSGRDVTECKKAKESLANVNDIIERSQSVIYLTNIETYSLKYISNNIKTLSGYTVNEFLTGKLTLAKLIHPKDLETIELELAENIKNKNNSFKFTPYRIICKSGEVKWVKDNVNIIKDENGKPIHSEGVITDITKQKNASDKLAQLTAIIERSEFAIIKWTPKEKTLVNFVTNNISKIFGYTKEDFLSGKVNYLNLIHPDDIAFLKKEMAENHKNKLTLYIHKPYRIITKSGEVKWIKDETTIIRDKNGEIISGEAILTNITKTYKTDQKLVLANNIIERSPSVVFLAKNEQNFPIEYVSNNAEKLFGYSVNEILNGDVSFFDLIYPEDFKKVTTKLSEFIQSKTSSVITKSFRGICKNGEIKWVKANLKFVKDKNRKITHIEGVFVDVTTSVKTKHELEILNIAVENSVNEVLIWDGENYKISFVNKGAIQNLGYTKEELLKMTPFDMKPDYSIEKFLKLISPLKSGEIKKLQFKTIHQRKNKTTYPIEINLSTFNVNDKLYFLGIIVDITEREKIEQELKQQFIKQHTILNAFEDGVYLSSDNYDIEYLNEGMLAKIGRNAVGEKCYKAIHNLDKPCSWCYFKNLKKDKTSTSIEVYLKEKNYLINSVLLDNNSKVSVYNDVSKLKKIEQTLKKQNKNYEVLNAELKIKEENYRLLFDENPVSLLEDDFTATDKIFQKLKASGVKNIEQYFNENPEILKECISNLKILNSNNASIQLFKAKDKDHLLANIDKILTHYTLLNYKNILVDIYNGKSEIVKQSTFKNLQQEEIIGNVRISLFRNKDEVKTIISIDDITDKIHAKNALLKSEERFRTIVENTSEWIWEVDINGVFTYNNPKIKQILGYSPEELIGENNIKYIHTSYKKNVVLKSIELIKLKQGWKNWEIKWVHKDGSSRYLESNATPILNKNGDVVGFSGVNRDITARKKRENENKKLSTAVEQSANTIIITNIGGDIEYVNPKFTELTGYTAKEVLGQNPRVINSGEQPKEFYCKMWKTISSGNTWKGQFKNKTKSGKFFWEQATITPIKNDDGTIINYLAIKEDITDKKLAEEKLKKQHIKLEQLTNELSHKNRLLLETKNRYLNLFEQSPVAIWEEDYTEIKTLIEKAHFTDLKTYLDENDAFVKKCLSKLKILNVNNNAVSILGVANKDEFISHMSKNLNHEKLETFKETLVSISTGIDEFIKETKFLKSDGSSISVILKLATDSNCKIIVSIINISALKVAEEKLQIQNKQLIESINKAEESDKLKTEFLNNMSHEIRTPLNGILGFSEILCDVDTTADKKTYFGSIIKNSGNQLMQVIDDILEISRLGTKQVTANNKEVCLNTVMLQLFSVFEIKAKENKVPLYLKKGLLDAESTIITDELKLNKILGNLLENAFKFTNEGHIDFGYILNNNNPAQLEIYVKDTGVGINKVNQKTIFDRFSQEEKALSRKTGGLGLGLSIAKENSELLGGSIILESDKGKGANFTVIIPYTPINPSFKSTKEKISSKISEEKPTILIAEDEEVNYLFLETLLHDSMKLDCNILHAKNGKEAVDICRENSAINLVLMDIKMPIITGYEATKLIREFNPSVPIIAQTAYSTSSDINKSIEIGCDDFISKPISKKTLNEVLKKHLKIKKA